MINSAIRSGDKVVDGYIEELERINASYGSTNTKKLIRSIDEMAGKISSDLDKISREQQNEDGTEVELSNKFVDTFIKMVDKSDKILSFSKIADSVFGVREDVVEQVTQEIGSATTKPPIIGEGGNPFETVIKKIKQTRT